MISFSSSQRFFLYRGATDMRRSFAGLGGIVVNELQKPLTTGDVFIFINKPRNSIKLLVWDRNGFVIYYKRLEEGTFEIPEGDEKSMTIKWEELVMMLEGIALKSVKRRKRYSCQPI
jgi:transposase